MAADPDRVDLDEWQKLRESARPTEEMGEVMDRLPANLACVMTKIAWPCAVEKEFRQPMLAGLHAMDERDAKAAKAGAKPGGRGSPNGHRQGGPLATADNGDPEAWLRDLMGEPTGHVDASVLGNGSPPVSQRSKRRARKKRKAAACARR
jgi:hypothetical protein